MAFAVSLLTNRSFLWWQRCIKDGKSSSTWDKFQRALRKAFVPANADFHTRSVLRRLTQKVSLAAYIAQFQRLTLEVDSLSPEDLFHNFVDGLEPKIRDDVHKYNAKSLQDAITYVERVGDLRRPADIVGIRPSNSKSQFFRREDSF